MKGETWKEIENITAGDIVLDSKGLEHEVKRLIPSLVTPDAQMLIFPPNCLGIGCPEQEVFVSSPHPIFFKGARKPASCFVGYNAIDSFANKEHPKMNFKMLYTLQFDHEASF